MRPTIALATLLLVAAFALPAHAVDVPQGADTLKLLANEATLIVRIGAPSEEPPVVADRPEEGLLTFTTYLVTVEEVVVGDGEPGQRLRIAIPTHLAIDGSEALSDSLVFLQPLTADQLNAAVLPRGETIYQVVSGRLGVVKISSAALIPAVRDYVLRADVAAGAIAWAETYVRHGDPFLQRSAIVDLYTQRDRQRAFDVLREVVASEAVNPANRHLAIEALEETGKAAAKTPLKNLAEDPDEPIGLREAAVRAYSNLPAVAEQMSQWRASGDSVLSTTAREAVSADVHATHAPD